MKKPDSIENQILVIRCQQGEQTAFEELVDRWQERLYRHAYHLTGEKDTSWDAVQETWIVIVRDLRRLHDPAAFPGWAYRILGNRCADWVRGRQRQRRLVERLSGNPGAVHSARDARLEVREALLRLPEERRTVLALHYGEGYDVAEMAEILGIPEGTVKSRLHHAREALRRLIEKDDE